tara:strand:- start:1373 stop:1630 length:258 start_codon:yes stop_codon:yes gene_type:complete
MTDEQINAAIETVLHRNEHWMVSRNYCVDLNAMHKAERALSSIDRNHYINTLGGMFDDAWAFALATARQRAEAFLRTLGKWEETE